MKINQSLAEVYQLNMLITTGH